MEYKITEADLEDLQSIATELDMFGGSDFASMKSQELKEKISEIRNKKLDKQ